MQNANLVPRLFLGRTPAYTQLLWGFLTLSIRGCTRSLIIYALLLIVRILLHATLKNVSYTSFAHACSSIEEVCHFGCVHTTHTYVLL
jgi:hypothetical protein